MAAKIERFQARRNRLAVQKPRQNPIWLKVAVANAPARALYATHIHRLLQALLDLPVPDYWHHGLIRDAAGIRLAKSKGAPALRDLRAAGMTAEEVRARADSA